LAYFAATNAFALLCLLPRCDRDKDIEILALRHQLLPARTARSVSVNVGLPDWRCRSLLHHLPTDKLRHIQAVGEADGPRRGYRNLRIVKVRIGDDHVVRLSSFRRGRKAGVVAPNRAPRALQAVRPRVAPEEGCIAAVPAIQPAAVALRCQGAGRPMTASAALGKQARQAALTE
jgi:hypothetical protein